ncbi:putative membrane protein [Desulfosporosinus acidiphilus SJ4]|uniref:Putative membrane protein n=1 Tax=Desulfosporosinus acidiphilus (strain DSM 22704 / JCM 16185 / SJ4) TaxID=646529 RepID=I4D466_DESAJ|nr:DMT family transporter [Desulfosporosinus acidiphilus]AFM40590.1 putative membrane protein [Desulfosporosinus acidiphilus SJ4]
MEQSAQLLLQKRNLTFAKKGVGRGLLSGAAWGLDGVLMGMVLGLAPFTNNQSIFAAPLVGACLHDGFAALWLFIYNIINGKWRDYARTLKTRPAKMIMLAAILGGPIGMSGNLLGIYFAGASYTAAITAAYPAVGALLGSVFLKEKISRRLWFGIIMAIFGSFIVGFVPPNSSNYPHFYLGIGLAVVGALGWAVEGVLSTYGMDLVDSDIAIGIREATSFLVYIVVILPLVGGVSFRILTASLASPAGWYIAVVGLVGGTSFLSWYRAMNMTGVGRTMGLSVTFALWSVFFGWLLNNLQLAPNLIIGVVIIFLGTVLSLGNPKDLLNLKTR